MLAKDRIEKAGSDNYLLQIFISSKCNNKILPIALKLFEEIKDIYRYIEPSNLKGDFIVCIALNNSVISDKKSDDIKYDKTRLMATISNNTVIQVLEENVLMWKNININSIIKMKNILFYTYKKGDEYFTFNNKVIQIKQIDRIHSIYSPYFPELENELTYYSSANILNSSCKYFNKSWADKKRLYFKNKPEEEMQISLMEYLRNTLRNNVEVVREYNLNAKKPVDIRVHWGAANRSALIEIKWLGVSLNEENDEIKTIYANNRATAGAKQLKEYLDLVARDTPNTITKGYLVVIDGRRKGISQKIISIVSEENGFHYQTKDLYFPEKYNYSETIYNFEPPIRMFARPVCQ
jgi:hypothetical protein